MARITFTTYRERRAKLKATWQTTPTNFVMLPPREQWDLHEYYRFADNLTAGELRQHWRDCKAGRHTSLPQRAGRAYHVFGPFLFAVSNRSADNRICVRGLVWSKVDVGKIGLIDYIVIQCYLL